MEQNSNLNHFQQLLFHTFHDQYNLFCAKTTPWVSKLGNFDWRVPKVSSRVTLAMSGAGVVSHINTI